MIKNYIDLQVINCIQEDGRFIRLKVILAENQ